MNAYSLDLRKKIVEAKQRGTPTSEVARSFGVGTVKRYAAGARECRSLAPKKRSGSEPKMGEAAMRLLEADLRERPAATLPHGREFLGRVAGVRVSDSTVSRVLKRLGWTRKKDCEYCEHGARDVSPRRSDPKKRGLRIFPAIRRPTGRASLHRRSESRVTS